MTEQVKKIVVIGSASTGKSTLSAMLANALGTVWVPEYARAYLEGLDRPYKETDLLQIATGQLRAEDEMADEANNFLICDTDLYVIKVWSEHSFDKCHRDILAAIADRRYDMYLLTDIDIPWEDDPLREPQERELRTYFYNQYLDIVMNSGLPWATVSGNPEERLRAAMAAVQFALG